MTLDDDEKLILQNDQTLRAAGVGKSLSLLFIKHVLQSESVSLAFMWTHTKNLTRGTTNWPKISRNKLLIYIQVGEKIHVHINIYERRQ